MESLPPIQLNWAAWTSLDTGVVSFTRDWTRRRHPELWWGEDRLPLKSLRRMSRERFGLEGGYYGRSKAIVFVLPASLVVGLDIKKGIFVCGSFNGWGEALGAPKWRLELSSLKDEECYLLEVPKKALQSVKEATFKFATGDGHWIDVPEHTPNTHVDSLGIKNYLFSPDRSGRHLFRFQTPLSLNQAESRKLYFRENGTVSSTRLNPGVFLKTLETEGPLGAIVGNKSTVFRVFAPRARSVSLYLFENPEVIPDEPVPMELTPELVWETEVDGDRHGWFYHYTVEGQETDEVGYFDPAFPVVDPYAKAVLGPKGPGIVVSDDFFEFEKVSFKPPHWHDLVIAEAHIRDLTDHAAIPMSDDERLEYSGLQKFVEHDSFYLREMGVNAVELQPIHEHDNPEKEEYAWGYMPVNYFSPSSQYSSDPSTLKQITEFRDLVQSFHRKGQAVLLDVVYNHIGEPNFLQYLDKEYYFLLNEDGHYENFSGCGNTLDANAPMVRRLILDSLIHWIEAFDVDGFRFDLGELIGQQTLAWLEPRLKAVKPEVILIAEPWSFRGHIGRQLSSTGFASWNDEYREYIRKCLTLDAGVERLGYFLKGSHPDWSRFPAQSVNYLDSHDDRCWIDKITENEDFDGVHPTLLDRRRTHLMIAIQMMSLGIPMVSSGIDMLKSKYGVNNTYLRGDLNAIPYERLYSFPGTTGYIRKWIAFRMSELGRLIRLEAYPENGYFVEQCSDGCLGLIYNADLSHGSNRLLFVVNPGYQEVTLDFGDVDFAPFVQLADPERWGAPYLEPPHFKSRAGKIQVPPLSSGLFISEG